VISEDEGPLGGRLLDRPSQLPEKQAAFLPLVAPVPPRRPGSCYHITGRLQRRRCGYTGGGVIVAADGANRSTLPFPRPGRVRSATRRGDRGSSGGAAADAAATIPGPARPARSWDRSPAPGRSRALARHSRSSLVDATRARLRRERRSGAASIHSQAWVSSRILTPRRRPAGRPAGGLAQGWWRGHQAGHGHAGAGDHDLLPPRGALEELRDLRLGFLDVVDRLNSTITHCPAFGVGTTSRRLMEVPCDVREGAHHRRPPTSVYANDSSGTAIGSFLVGRIQCHSAIDAIVPEEALEHAEWYGKRLI